MRDPDVLHPRAAAVLAAVTHVWLDGRPVTVRAVRHELGLHSTSSVHWHLVNLRRLGLVSWRTGKASTLRPTFTIHEPRKATDAPR